MRNGRWIIIVAVLALLTSACGSGEEGEGTTTPDGDGTTTQAPNGPSTTEWSPDVGATCYYLDNYVWLGQGTQEQVAAALIDAGINAYQGILTPEEIADAEPGVTMGDPPPLDEFIDIISIESGGPSGSDPLTVTTFARDQGAPAAPVYLVGMASHWQFKPGTDPKQSDAAYLIKDVTPNTSNNFIAVVDTGVEVGEAFPWMFDNDPAPTPGDSIVFTDSGDDFQLGGPAGQQPSHGTFISSLLRQLAPDYRVSFAAMNQNEDVSGASWSASGYPRADGPGDGTLSNEIDALGGIEEIIKRHGGVETDKVVALNLSWGTYPCELNGDFSDVLALETAMEAWYNTFGESQVFAAAGNEGPHLGEFYPAALPNVTGVGPLSPDDDPVFWDDGKPIFQAGLSAATWAQGCAIVGVSGLGGAWEVVSWGGSSFATPIVAAAWAQLDDPNADPANSGVPDEIPTDPNGTC